jgi:hypothetical protein
VHNDVVKTRLYRARRMVRDNLGELLNDPRRPSHLPNLVAGNAAAEPSGDCSR